MMCHCPLSNISVSLSAIEFKAKDIPWAEKKWKMKKVLQAVVVHCIVEYIKKTDIPALLQPDDYLGLITRDEDVRDTFDTHHSHSHSLDDIDSKQGGKGS